MREAGGSWLILTHPNQTRLAKLPCFGPGVAGDFNDGAEGNLVDLGFWNLAPAAVDQLTVQVLPETHRVPNPLIVERSYNAIVCLDPFGL